jgi:hypothetical protein
MITQDVVERANKYIADNNYSVLVKSNKIVMLDNRDVIVECGNFVLDDTTFTENDFKYLLKQLQLVDNTAASRHRKEKEAIRLKKELLKEQKAKAEELEKKQKEIKAAMKEEKRNAFIQSIPTPQQVIDKLGNVYFHRGTYLLETKNAFGDKIYYTYTTEPLKRMLIKCGMSENKFGNTLSSVEETLLYIETNNVIDDYRDLAGYSAGLKKINNRAVVVTQDTKIVEPKEGEFPLFDELITQMFGEKQKPYFMHWLSAAYNSFVDEDSYQRGQALFLVGTKKSCKNLLQDCITQLLGARVCNPTTFFCKETDFNSELFSSTHLKIDDMPPKEDRNSFTGGLKNWIASTDAKCHQKGMTPQIYVPHSRTTISLNDDYYSLQALPQLVNSVMDKISLFAVNKPDLSKRIPPSIMNNPKRLNAIFYAELPALAYYLKNKHEIPEDQIDSRFGVVAYHNEELLRKVEPNTRAATLLEYFDMYFDNEDKEYIEGTSTEIHSLLRKSIYTFNIQVKDMRYILRDCKDDPRFAHRVHKSPNSTDDKTIWKISSLPKETNGNQPEQTHQENFSQVILKDNEGKC